MSTAAGGEIVAVAGAAVAGAACLAVIAAGGLVLGAGYLAFQGGFRAIKACQKAIKDHQAALEAQRQARLEALRQADETLMERLQHAAQEWASAGRDALQQKEALLQQELVQAQAKLLEVERQAAETASTRQQLKVAEQEIDNLRAHRTPPLVQGKEKEQRYQAYLYQEKATLEERLKQYAQPLDFDALIAVSAPHRKPVASAPVPTSDYWQRLALCQANLVVLFSLTAEVKQPLMAEIASVEELLNESGADADKVAGLLSAIESRISQAQAQEEIYRQERRQVQEQFLALQDDYITIKADNHLAANMSQPLEELKKFLDHATVELAQPKIDTAAYLKTLPQRRAAFEAEVHAALMTHQASLNEGVSREVDLILGELGYQERRVEARDGGIWVFGTGSEEHPEAEATLVISPEGMLAIDLSGKGFKSQKACTREFNRLEATLLRHGIQVNIEKHASTWFDYMEQYFRRELGQLLPGQNITVTKTEQFLRIETVGVEDLKTVIELDGDTGQLTKTEGQAVHEIINGSPLASQKKARTIHHGKKTIKIKPGP